MLRFGMSPKTLFSEGAPSILLQLLEGISIDVKFNIWKKITDIFKQIIDLGAPLGEYSKIVGGISPALLLRLALKLDITIDSYMKQKIVENPIV